MLHYAVVFLIIALLAGVFGFFGVAGMAASIAKVLFVLFLVLFYPIMLLWRGFLREKERWSESDFSPYTTS